MSIEPHFLHRELPSHLYESICPPCHQTIGVLDRESTLRIDEERHACTFPPPKTENTKPRAN